VIGKLHFRELSPLGPIKSVTFFSLPVHDFVTLCGYSGLPSSPAKGNFLKEKEEL
jgi:hypothetical protein